MELDDTIIEASIARNGVVGVVDRAACVAIKKYLAIANTLSKKDKDEICAILDGC